MVKNKITLKNFSRKVLNPKFQCENAGADQYYEQHGDLSIGTYLKFIISCFSHNFFHFEVGGAMGQVLSQQ